MFDVIHVKVHVDIYEISTDFDYVSLLLLLFLVPFEFLYVLVTLSKSLCMLLDRLLRPLMKYSSICVYNCCFSGLLKELIRLRESGGSLRFEYQCCYEILK